MKKIKVLLCLLIRLGLLLLMGVAFFHEGGSERFKTDDAASRNPAGASPNLESFMSPVLSSSPASSSSLLPLTQSWSNLNSTMSAQAAGIQSWTPAGGLPGPNSFLSPPSFTLASMGCGVTSVDFLGEGLPGISCGGFADQLVPASGSFYGLTPESASGQTGLAQFSGGRVAIPASAAAALH